MRILFFILVLSNRRCSVNIKINTTSKSRQEETHFQLVSKNKILPTFHLLNFYYHQELKHNKQKQQYPI